MDLSHLIKRLDDVANGATGVARRINTIPYKFWEQSSKVSIDILIEMANKTVKCAEYLDKIVSDLITERKHVKEYAEHINRLEHEVDLLNIELREKLQKTKYENINSFTIFTVGNTIDIVEAISDSIEAVADYIILLLTSENV
jgi:predicted phosphate transport protein (TIGR00153 family)